MSFKNLITTSYGDDVYKSTKKLQDLTTKSVISKNQWTFLNRCLFHYVTPNSFRTRSTLKTRKGNNITSLYNRKMMVATRNFAKEKYHRLLQSVTALMNELRTILNEPDFATLSRITEIARKKRLKMNSSG